MATSTAAVQTAQAAPHGSASKDAQLLGKLAKLWASHQSRDLEVRLETGSLLNARLGEPTTRQRRGRSVLKQAAETLHVAVSELNRMRWLSHFSKDEKSVGVKCLTRITLGPSLQGDSPRPDWGCQR